MSWVASASPAPWAPGIGWDCGIGRPWGPPWLGLIARSMVVDSSGVSGREAASGGSGALPGAPTGGISAVASASPEAGGSGAPVCWVARTSSPDGPRGCCPYCC
ncbi:hypothetical protein [Streptomyces sp. RPA4-5]|uniref:hypothetical protein n=1 Tax=Streptomyces sp. RPA4-5 TaxID=2721245 RepID=UPI0032B54A57